MVRCLRRFAAVLLVALAAGVAWRSPRADADDCVHAASCPERLVDKRGCCRAPPPRPAERPGATAEQPGAPVERPAGPTPISILLRRQQPGAGCPPDMVVVPGATFAMGSPAGVGEDAERPQHDVTLAAYCLDRTEVTVAAYARCVTGGKCIAATEPAADGVSSACNGTRADRRSHPINCVDWGQAEAYCAFAGKRLPTEAEWEYAALSGTGQSYPWGNAEPGPRRLNACGGECRALARRMGLDSSVMYGRSDGWEATAPVGSFPAGASPFGALDLAGNVAEWTADWYLGYAGTASRFGDGPHRVVRGGAWTQAAASEVRGASRRDGNPRRAGIDVGFRCARAQ